ncbi:MAG: penicillin acylase family protein [Methylomonas sp.]|nr:penicillin acylase family protein [Methylomonas sp.]
MRRFFTLLMLSTILLIGCLSMVLVVSLAVEDGEISLSGLAAKVTVSSDDFGVPAVSAENRIDAYRALGYLHARDRLFQMELMRRKSAGRLAELFGVSALKTDRMQRAYQLSKTAADIVGDLPTEQRRVLRAYAEGINAYLKQTSVLPPEFLALRHRPESWREEDSLLVILGMFQNLNGQEQDERMVSVMEKALPAELVTFLTPDTDMFSNVLVGGTAPRRFSNSISPEVFAALPAADMPVALNSVDVENIVAGSNNWVVAGSKTADGRAIVANDMHLGLAVPNVWYRADLRYQGRHLYGVTLPGVPGVIVGGNENVAWGFTNVTADLVDLIRLELNPDNSDEYRTPQGWATFGEHREIIHVKDGQDVELTLKDTVWGPVSEQALLGQQVAVKWTALERGAVDLGLLDMDQVETSGQAIEVMNRSGAPPQNVVIADRDGHIAWTYMGRFPHRIGFDGLVSRSWADGRSNWQGFIPEQGLPRLLDPAEGFIVTANNRTLGSEYPYLIGHNWALGYRAYRIAERLRGKNNLTEQDLFEIQLDTRGGVYDFYRQLALEELRQLEDKDGQLEEIEQVLAAWDGHMGKDSIGAAFLSEFRSRLAVGVFAKIVAACKRYDPGFRYAWREMETPLRLLLNQRPQGLLAAEYRDDWRLMIVQTLRQTAEELHAAFPNLPLNQLKWSQAHVVEVQHPFSRVSPILSRLLDMPSFGSDGCASICVKVMGAGHSASERLVLSPSHLEDAIFHMPGGQSGHPLSRHYRDQQAFWQRGIAAPLQSDNVLHTLSLVPANDER